MQGNEIQPLLTSRETEILGWIANGYSAKETAQSIGIAPRTVERHIENLRLKMRARNRVHLIVRAVREGILEITIAKPVLAPEQGAFWRE
jgi:LuxR family transcriptional regulator of spore coat protein